MFDQNAPKYNPIKSCRRLLKFQCPKTWQALTPTVEENVRFCETCRQNVYFCNSDEEVQSHKKDCVALSSETEEVKEIVVVMGNPR